MPPVHSKKKIEETAVGLGTSRLLSTDLVLPDAESFLTISSTLRSFKKNFLNEISRHTVRYEKIQKKMQRTFWVTKTWKETTLPFFSAEGVSSVKWMDNRFVLILSTFFLLLRTVHFRRRSAKKIEKLTVLCPLVVSEHTQAIGCVNLMNQKKATCEVDQWSRIKYYLRLFFDILDIGVRNSLNVYGKRRSENSEVPTLTLHELEQAAARGLSGNKCNRQRSATTLVQRKERIQVSTKQEAPGHQMSKASARNRIANCAKLRV